MESRLLVIGGTDEEHDWAALLDELQDTVDVYLSDAEVREATPADVTEAFVEQCRADGRGPRVRLGLLARRKRLTGTQRYGRWVLEALGLSALLEAPAVSPSAREALPADCGNWCAYWSAEEGCKAYDCKAQDDAALLEAPATGGLDGS